MRFKNNGNGEENMMQNRFTAYLQKAVQRRKITYLKEKARLEQHEVPSDLPEETTREDEWESGLHYSFQIENGCLTDALEHLGERERLILLAVVLEEQNFTDLGGRLGLLV